MLKPEVVNKLKEQPEWKELEEHIRGCIDAIDSCTSIPDSDDHEKAARGRKEAVKILHAVLEPFLYDPQPLQDKRDEALRKLGMK